MDIHVDLRRLLRELLDPALIVSPRTHTIVAASELCEPVTGFCTHELVGQDINMLAPTKPVPRRDPVCWRTLLQHPGRHEEVPVRRKDDSYFLAEVSVSSADVHDQSLHLLFLRDLTERRKLERELITKHVALKEAYVEVERANEELARANAEIQTAQRWLVNLEKMATIGRFAAGVAHEVNNPMAFVLENLTNLQIDAGHIVPVLKSYLELAGPAASTRKRIGRITNELNELIGETLDGAQRVSKIMRQLHSFSNVSDQEAEWTDLRTLIDSSIMMVQNQIKYRARLERHYYDIPDVLCVPNNISQVIVNLLVNAIHAMDGGDASENIILVRSKRIDEAVVVEVQDNGCGIPPENLGRIMEPFFTTKTRGKGTGLGLAISASVMEQHGGLLEAESKVGQGTLMRMVLPVQGRLRQAPKKDRQPQSAVGKLRILMVDDEVYFLRAIKRSLGKFHEVQIADGAEQGLEHLSGDDRYDLVMADLMMPGINGVEFYQELERRHPQLAPKVVFMSGGVFEDDVRAFLKREGQPVLNKPFKLEEFEQVIGKLFARNEERAAEGRESKFEEREKGEGTLLLVRTGSNE
jgi:PAS domain S-box-containing protein